MVALENDLKIKKIITYLKQKGYNLFGISKLVGIGGGFYFELKRIDTGFGHIDDQTHKITRKLLDRLEAIGDLK